MHRRPQLQVAGNGRKLRLVGNWEADPLDGLCESAGLARAVDKLQRKLNGCCGTAVKTVRSVGSRPWNVKCLSNT